ncbi:MAG: S-methyl-5-thioribose-1-phosphate isomerase [Gammaproteobacteria bacterium]
MQEKVQAADEGFEAVAWRDDAAYLLDQRLLPQREEYLRIETAAAMAEAIGAMVVRGAPAIGIAAGYGVALAARAAHAGGDPGWRVSFAAECARLRAARPTAVNLGWAVDRLVSLAAGLQGDPFPALLDAARTIHAEDIAANRRMGDLGAALIGPDAAVITHCNAGALATGGYGTALGVIRSAWRDGRIARIYAGETRPWLQGARLTAWELQRSGLPVTLVADGAMAHLMRTRRIDWVVVGADRIAANGDVANKIGTYSLAVHARAHGARFMVAAPLSTFDPAIADGAAIEIEERDPGELLQLGGRRIAAAGAGAWNPVFDLTPAALIDAIVTERGVVERPDAGRIARLLG